MYFHDAYNIRSTVATQYTYKQVIEKDGGLRHRLAGRKITNVRESCTPW